MSDTDIRSEIAGRVWKVPAAAGAVLESGAPIVILESMKMEIPVTAPAACTVVEVTVAEGEEVAEGQVVAKVRI